MVKIRYAIPAESTSPILSQIKDPVQYPVLTSLGVDFLKMKFFREWNPGPYAPPRQAQKADLPGDFLLEDASNLGLVLNDLQNRPVEKRIILDKLRAFNDSIEDVTTNVKGTMDPSPTFRQLGASRGFKGSLPFDGSNHGGLVDSG